MEREKPGEQKGQLFTTQRIMSMEDALPYYAAFMVHPPILSAEVQAKPREYVRIVRSENQVVVEVNCGWGTRSLIMQKDRKIIRRDRSEAYGLDTSWVLDGQGLTTEICVTPVKGDIRKYFTPMKPNLSLASKEVLSYDIREMAHTTVDLLSGQNGLI